MHNNIHFIIQHICAYAGLRKPKTKNSAISWSENFWYELPMSRSTKYELKSIENV